MDSAEIQMDSSEDALGTDECQKIIENLESTLELFHFSPRLNISDDLQVGFFRTDHATQTDYSEILPIKELSSTTQKLMQAVKSLTVDFGFLKDLLHFQFEDRIKEEAFHLFTNLQDRIMSIEKYYKQNEEQMRKCFNQQLADAIAITKGMYTQFFDVEEEETSVQDSNVVKINVLLKKLKEKDKIIKELTEEIEEYEEDNFPRLSMFKESLYRDLSPPRASIEKENLEWRAENERLMQIISGLEEEIQLNVKENTVLEAEILSLKEKAEKDHKAIQRLIDGREKLRLELENEKLFVQDLLSRQKEDMEMKRRVGSISSKGVRAAKGRESPFPPLPARHTTTPKSMIPSGPVTYSASTSPVTKPKHLKESSKEEQLTEEEPYAVMEQDRAKEAQEVQVKMKELPRKERRRGFVATPDKPSTPLSMQEEKVKMSEDKKYLEDQVAMLRTALQNERKKAERLRRDTEKINKSWEKKFFVLRNSFHALKDEMFTRHTLFRQFAVLADTSFNYTKVKPLFVQSSMTLADTTSSESILNSFSVENKYADIDSDQLSLQQSLKGRLSETQAEGRFKRKMPPNTPMASLDMED